MIQIKEEIKHQIIGHARKELPNEACGYLAGKEGVIFRVFTMTNTDRSPEHFSFDPDEQFAVLRQARKEGLTIMANYHSHPSTPSRPSEEDIKLAYDPNISYLIISLAGESPELRSFRIVNNKAEAEELKEII